MEEQDASDWLCAIEAREADSRIHRLFDMANATRSSKNGLDQAKRRIARDRKLALNLHKAIDPGIIKHTEERILAQLGIKTPSGSSQA